MKCMFVCHFREVGINGNAIAIMSGRWDMTEIAICCCFFSGKWEMMEMPFSYFREVGINENAFFLFPGGGK